MQYTYTTNAKERQRKVNDFVAADTHIERIYWYAQQHSAQQQRQQ